MNEGDAAGLAEPAGPRGAACTLSLHFWRRIPWLCWEGSRCQLSPCPVPASSPWRWAPAPSQHPAPSALSSSPLTPMSCVGGRKAASPGAPQPPGTRGCAKQGPAEPPVAEGTPAPRAPSLPLRLAAVTARSQRRPPAPCAQPVCQHAAFPVSSSKPAPLIAATL